MKYINIPNTDLRVSQLCIGSEQLGASITPTDSAALLDTFVAAGGNFIDSAHIYADWIPGTKSTSEKIIGQWLKANGARSQLVIATKGAHPVIETMHNSRLSRADIAQDIDEGLEYLQTDTIDLYWLHRDDQAIPVSEIIDVMDEQVKAGKIRYFGASNWTIPRIQAALDYSARKGINSFVANQPLFSLAVPSMDLHPDKTIVALDAAGIAFHKRTGMAVVAYSSQAHGFFTKLDSAGLESIREPHRSVYNNATNMKRLERIRELARRHSAQINDIVLAYLFSQPFPTIPVIGPKNLDQLRSSLQAVDLTLTSDELALLESA